MDRMGARSPTRASSSPSVAIVASDADAGRFLRFSISRVSAVTRTSSFALRCLRDLQHCTAASVFSWMTFARSAMLRVSCAASSVSFISSSLVFCACARCSSLSTPSSSDSWVGAAGRLYSSSCGTSRRPYPFSRIWAFRPLVTRLTWVQTFGQSAAWIVYLPQQSSGGGMPAARAWLAR